MQPPSPPQRVTYPAPSPEPQRGGGEREGGQGEPTEKQSSIKKHRVFRLGAFLHIRGNESACIAPGRTLREYNSTPAGGCQHRSRIKSNLSSPRGFTNCVDVVQSRTPVDRSPGARARKKGGLARPLRAPGLEPPPTPAADHHRTPDAKRGNRRAHGRPQGRPGAFVDEAVRLPAVARRATAPPRGSPEQPQGERQTPTNWGVRATAPQGGS